MNSTKVGATSEESLPSGSTPQGGSSYQSSLAQLVIQDFQSIEGAVLDLAPLTVIVGKGDSGKSAVLRALRAALFNDSGDDFVRSGTKQATVALAFSDGNVLIWEKPLGKGSSYNLNGQPFTKLAGQVPAEVSDVTGFRAIEVDGSTSITPQMHDQFDQPFILFESGSRVARILGTLTKLNAVVQAQLICKKNGNVWSQTVAQNETELARLQAQRAEMPDVDYLLTVIDGAGADLKVLEDARRSLDRAYSLHGELASIREKETHDFGTVHDDLDEADALLTKMDKTRRLVKELQGARTASAQRIMAIEVAKLLLDTENESYTAACGSEGVCEACPYVR